MSRPDRSIARAIALAGFAFVPFAAIAGAQANMAPINSAPNPYTTVDGLGKDARGSHVGFDERGRHRPRRQEHLGRRAVRHEQLRRLHARSGAQVRFERDSSSRTSARD